MYHGSALKVCWLASELCLDSLGFSPGVHIQFLKKDWLIDWLVFWLTDWYLFGCTRSYLGHAGSSPLTRASQLVLVVKNLPAIAGDGRDAGLTLGLEDPPGGGHGNPLQYSCLESPIDRWGLKSMGLQSAGHDWSGSAASSAAGSSTLTRGWTQVFCIAWGLSHWTTREVLIYNFQGVTFLSSSLLISVAVSSFLGAHFSGPPAKKLGF